jgi:hypothetical protein
VSACAAAGKLPPPGWSKPEQNVESVFSPTTRELGDSTSKPNLKIGELWALLNQRSDLGAIHGIGAPIHIYPLYENGFRAHRKQTFAENNAESAKLYAESARVAERQPYAWNYGKPAATEQFIGTVSKKNRMICFPCKAC